MVQSGGKGVYDYYYCYQQQGDKYYYILVLQMYIFGIDKFDIVGVDEVQYCCGVGVGFNLIQVQCEEGWE